MAARKPRRRIYTIFLSSTAKDLAAYRDAVCEAINAHDDYKCVRMEDFGARSSGVREFLKQKVADCDGFVGIVGHLHGSRPKRVEQSYTELEYEAAVKAGMPRLMFVAPDDFVLPAKMREPDKQAAAQTAFRERVMDEQIVSSFASPESLAARVSQAIANELVPRFAGEPKRETVEVEDDLAAYLDAIESQHEQLRLVGFGGRLRTKIRLEDMYVPLDAQVDDRVFGDMRAGNPEELECDVREVPMTEAFQRAQQHGGRRGLVLLGEPGAGKTTHLKRLLLWVRKRGTAELGLPADVVPVFLALRDLDAGLDDFLQSQLDDHPHLDLAPGFAAGLRKRGKLLFLLDGLDEIRRTEEREKVVRWIEAALAAYPDSWFVVTCRYAGYRGLAEQFSAEFLELHLRPMNEDQARSFVHNWFRIVEAEFAQDAGQARTIARGKADDLLARLRERRADTRVFEMTRNPLLLTSLCLVHSDGGGLPDRRAGSCSRSPSGCTPSPGANGRRRRSSSPSSRRPLRRSTSAGSPRASSSRTSATRAGS
ncbi:MAG: DUF4062 domain-containing protein [bacterium]|nr:DUF4062 domain-containing protein [bacterium]